MTRLERPLKPRNEAGTILLEVLISILIFSFGILGIIGLQGAGVKSTTDAKYRLDASFAASEIVGEMWVADNAALSSFNATTPVSTLPSGYRQVTVVGQQATVLVTWTPPGGTAHSFTLTTQISANP